ncbi:transposase [Streptomyces sp. NBC_00878]|nr:transposase [Streptomyces sp. NBC_00878]
MTLVVIPVEERCGGADLGKTDVKVCIRVPGTGKRARCEVRTFSTMNDGLLEVRDWLVENRIARIGMEATASYWKPLFYLLEATEGIEPWLLNSRHIKTVPGRKTDVKDCQWICKLVEHGLVRPSFVPPCDIRQLRDLTRYRTETVRDRARDVNRLAMFLEDTGIKLSSVVTDITGRSARAMLACSPSPAAARPARSPLPKGRNGHQLTYRPLTAGTPTSLAPAPTKCPQC